MFRNLVLFKTQLFKKLATKLNVNSWFRIAQADLTPAILSRRHIYILPTRFGVMFAVLLFGMLLGSMNYSLSLGFALTFLLAGVGHAAMLHTWRNIAHLTIKLQHIHSPFAGEPLQVALNIAETKGRDRTGVLLHFECSPPFVTQMADIAAHTETSVTLSHNTSQRGILKPARIKVYTEFPLTLCHAWAYVQLDAAAIIYPALSGLDRQAVNSLDATPDHKTSQVSSRQAGTEDFAGHRAYQSGDNLKKVNWKASSKLEDVEFGTPNLLLKEYEGATANSLVFDWEQTIGLAHEARISLLARWVVDATDANLAFALKIPQLVIAKNTGSAHLHTCLTALALMP